jgi:hypothetical protein
MYMYLSMYVRTYVCVYVRMYLLREGVTSKCNGALVQVMKACVEVVLQLHGFLTLTLCDGERSVSRLGHFTPDKLGWRQSRSKGFGEEKHFLLMSGKEKIMLLYGNEPSPKCA